jgi:hypothetical protein
MEAVGGGPGERRKGERKSENVGLGLWIMIRNVRHLSRNRRLNAVFCTFRIRANFDFSVRELLRLVNSCAIGAVFCGLVLCRFFEPDGCVLFSFAACIRISAIDGEK